MKLKRLVPAVALFLGACGRTMRRAGDNGGSRGRPAVCDVRNWGAFPARNGKERETDLRPLRQLSSATAEWCTVRHVFLGKPGLSQAA